MPTLTYEAIRRNPWNVVAHTLPAQPSRLLLETAHLAVDYCRKSEFIFMLAAREGSYTPRDWEPTEDYPDIHEENEARSRDADRRLDEICDLYEQEYGETLER